jgi:hypothetical protein
MMDSALTDLHKATGMVNKIFWGFAFEMIDLQRLSSSAAMERSGVAVRYREL